MYLSNEEIYNCIVYEKSIFVGVAENIPYLPSQISFSECGIYLHLDPRYLKIKPSSKAVVSDNIDLTDEEFIAEYFQSFEDTIIVLAPGESVFVSSVEYLKINQTIVGITKTPGFLSTMGLHINISNDLVDPNYEGKLWFNITNLSPITHVLTSNMNIVYLTFQYVIGDIINV